MNCVIVALLLLSWQYNFLVFCEEWVLTERICHCYRSSLAKLSDAWGWTSLEFPLKSQTPPRSWTSASTIWNHWAQIIFHQSLNCSFWIFQGNEPFLCGYWSTLPQLGLNSSRFWGLVHFGCLLFCSWLYPSVCLSAHAHGTDVQLLVQLLRAHSLRVGPVSLIL